MSLRWLFIAAMAIGALVAALVAATRVAQRATLRVTCSNNLKAIGIGLHNYYDVYHSFPPAITYDSNGTPLHSWRVLIIPYLMQNGLYEEYHLDEPWNGSANRRLTDEVADDFGGKFGTMLFDAKYFGYRCPARCRHRIACSRTT